MGKELSRFPIDWSQEAQYPIEAQAEILSPTGKFIGMVLVKKRIPNIPDNPITIVVFFILMFIGFLIAITIYNARRIFEDMLKLGSAVERGEKTPDLYFKETRTVLKTISKQYAELLKAERERAFLNVVNEVAHDIRAPLTVLDISLANASNIPSANLRRMRDAVEQIKKTTSELKEVKTLPADGKSTLKNEITYQRKAIQVQRFLEDIVDQKLIQYKDKVYLTFSLQVEEAFQPYVYGDPDWLKRALSNLLDNAAEATNCSGNVTITASNDLQDVVIEISDNGKGMTDEQVRKLGQHRIKSEKENGMGLGVFAAKRTVEDFHGAIAFSSQLAKGTKVTIRLPAMEAATVTPQKIQIGKNEKILVLDDDSIIRECWQILAVKLGFQDRLMLFENPSDFIAYVSSDSIEAIQCFVDYDLKGFEMNGLDVIECTKLTRVSTLVTGQADNVEVVQRSRQLGVKLFDKQQLTETNLVIAV